MRKKTRLGYVYLLHIDPPYQHAKHYIGWTNLDTPEERVNKHQTSNQTKLTNAARLAGCKFVLARIWTNVDRNFERKLKNERRTPYHCPFCHEEFMARRRELNRSYRGKSNAKNN